MHATDLDGGRGAAVRRVEARLGLLRESLEAHG